MNTEPLADYCWRRAEHGPFGARPSFAPRDSGCWRGYEGRWAIENGRLYMTQVEGHLADGREATLAVLFPGAPQPVFAEWFSGVLVVNDGEVLKYVHMGYESVYERTLLIKIVDGVVRDTERRENPDPKKLERLMRSLFVERDPADRRSFLDDPPSTEPPKKG